MVLEILAVSLATIGLLATVAMLMIGFANLADMPVCVRCRQCSHWTYDMNHRHEPTCMRCRLTGGGSHASTDVGR